MALVVEDEPGVRDLVVALLTDDGWSVDVVSGGRAGLARLRARRYDLIVSDIRMPDGSGEELYRSAIAAEPALGARFLFMTGAIANPDSWVWLRESGTPLLEKPFAPGAFVEAVRRIASGLTASGPSA
jgi:DNA-binding response OmpR family regulator